MKERILKELKSMLMPIIVGLLIPPLCFMLFEGYKVGYVIICIQVAIYLYLSVGLFGNEFKNNTIQRLLAQPISRKRIWYEKLSILLTVITILFFYFLICYILVYLPDKISWDYIKENNEANNFIKDRLKIFTEYFFVFIISILAIVATSQYLTLIFKNNIISLYGSIALIGVILVLSSYLYRYFIYPMYDSELFREIIFPSVPLLLCTLIFYPLAYRKFLRLEVV